MKTTHTPEPWVDSECTRLGHSEFMHQIRTGEGEDHPIVALVPHGNEVENLTADANSRLIAAAPELLASCEAAVRYLEKVKELAVSLSAMVPNLPPMTAGTIASDLHTVCSNTRKIRAAIAKAKGEA